MVPAAAAAEVKVLAATAVLELSLFVTRILRQERGQAATRAWQRYPEEQFPEEPAKIITTTFKSWHREITWCSVMSTSSESFPEWAIP